MDFNSLVNRVKQTLGGVQKQVPKTLMDIGNSISGNAQYIGQNALKNILSPQTAQSNFNLLRQNTPKIDPVTFGKVPAAIGNTALRSATNLVANAGESVYSGVPKILEASKMYQQNKYSPMAYVKGGFGIGQAIAPTTPFFQGANVMQSMDNDIASRFGTGLLRGQTGANINPKLQEKRINTPIGNFDPVVAAGSMAGFIKNPTWNKVFSATTPINQAKMLANPLLNYLATRSTKGSIEGAIQGAAEWSKDKSITDNLKNLGITTAFGLISEVAMDKPAEIAMKQGSKAIIQTPKRVLDYLESISMTGSQKAFARQAMVGNTRTMHPEDLAIFDQANTIVNEPKKFRPEQIQEARNYLNLFAEKYLPNRLQSPSGDAKFNAKQLQKRMSGGDLQTFEGGFAKLDEPIVGTKAVDPLLSEAKKYKSAEEFVKGQLKNEPMVTVYRGSKSGKVHENIKDFTFFATNKEYAQQYMSKGEKLVEYKLPESALLRDKVNTQEVQYLVDSRNPKISQLTDIWNKANKGVDTKIGSQTAAQFEVANGWKPGQKAEFDRAMLDKDAVKVSQMLDSVPDYYKQKFAPTIQDVMSKGGFAKLDEPILSTSQPKTGRTIKVAGQSRRQQPIGLPSSDNGGTQAVKTTAQTLKSSSVSAPLDKSIPQRGFAESVQTNKKTPAEIKPELEKLRYEPLTNPEVMAKADKIIKKSESKALDFAKNNTDTTANSVSLKLIEKFLDQGRFSEANDLIAAVSPRFTKAGQEIQILSTYGRLTPTGAIKYAQNLINQANKANPRLNLKLTEVNTKIITEFANKVQSLPIGSRERVVATAQLMQKITDQVPATIGQKIATIQTMMQLLNPKTAIRNILGNTIFTGAENVSDVLATGIDRVTSLITGNRSKVLPSVSAQGKGFIKGLKEGYQDAMMGIDTSGGVSSQFEIKGKTFTDPILGTLEKALNIELRVPDRAAYTAAFEGSLNNQMRAGGVTKATPEMIEIAHADGLYRTFQDNSRLAQIFSGIKKTLNKIGTPDGKFGLGDFVLKYPKTPANILSRGLDYSPAGFVKGIYEGIRPFISGQPFNQKQFVESLSRAMTGTGLIAAGYVLAKNGIISGKNDKDYDISSVKRTTGQGAFKMNVSALARYFQSGGQKQDDQNGDTLVSYDWSQPTSIQVAMGANSALGGSAEDIATIASDNLQAGVDTLTGQSMVKNLMDYASGVKDKGFVGATQDMVLNSATGFIPSVLRQSANVFDPIQRSTYAETPGGVAINKAKATIPFLRNTLEPKLDVFGKEMPNYEGSGLQRMFDIFVNPAFVTKIQENPAAKEVIDIYQRSGLTTQAPRVADSKIKINGEDIKVSPQQYTEYQKYIGTKTDKTFNSLMTDPLFMKSSDEEKAKFLQGVLTDINSAAKIELFGNKPKTVPQDVKDILKGSGDITGRMVTLTKEGNLKMATGEIEYPKLTGNTELDKKLISAYRGKLTQKANEITAMFEAGEITAAQAETELNKLIELKNKVSTTKAKKAPKITVKKLSAPKVAKGLRIKMSAPKVKKIKPLKLKKYTVKLSK